MCGVFEEKGKFLRARSVTRAKESNQKNQTYNPSAARFSISSRCFLVRFFGAPSTIFT